MTCLEVLLCVAALSHVLAAAGFSARNLEVNAKRRRAVLARKRLHYRRRRLAA